MQFAIQGSAAGNWTEQQDCVQFGSENDGIYLNFGHFHVENDDKLVDFRDARNSTHNFMPFHQNFFLPTLSD